MATATEQRVRALVAPLVESLELRVYDVEHRGGVLRVLIDRDGGADLDAISEATRRISRALDDDDPISGSYTLEVSSPGLERPLRTVEQWSWAVGRTVTVRLTGEADGPRRLSGTVLAADDDVVTLELDEPPGEQERVPYELIERARTTFAWGGAPKPGGKAKAGG